jgi:peptide/nickel transport system ATP-binding protein
LALETTQSPGPAGEIGRPTIDVRNLSVSYSIRHESTRVVDDVSFDIGPGEVVAVVGESGSGKTTIAQSLIGLLPPNGHLDGGKVLLNGTDIAGWSPKRLEAVRGKRIGLVPQDPANSLNPVRTIGANLGEVLQIHKWGDKQKIRHQVLELLDRVGIPEPAIRIDQYPHEFSGGMRQRVLIANAIALEPELIIADEPTSALDVTVQKRILDLLDDLRREFTTAILFVTHDLTIAAERSTSIIVLKNGRVQEYASTKEILTNPKSSYTKTLLGDAPGLSAVRARPPSVTSGREGEIAYAITATDVVQEFPRGRGQASFRALDSVSFRVAAGTTHALVGESGSGKTTAARAVVGLRRPTAGQILVAGSDVVSLRRGRLREFRKKVQLVYQNPFESLNPLLDIEEIVAEPLKNFALGDRSERMRKAAEYLDLVALPKQVLKRKPRELSGGQRQRVAIARALILDPQVVVLDEAVSALDVTVQGQVLRLLDELQQRLGLTYLFISHDLAVVAHIAHTVSVMELGRVVESGPTETIFANPTHEYTRALLQAIPVPKYR